MNAAGFPILSLITWLPLVGGLIIMSVRGDEETVASNARWTALWTSLIVLVLSVVLWVKFDQGEPGFQFVEELPWLPEYGVGYKMGVDGISVLFVLLSTVLTPICILASWDSITRSVREYMLTFLILETMMVGMFCALDFVVFYMFFEGVLIPMFLIIGIWGGPRRVYSAFKFFLFTLTGSVLMLLALLAMWFQAGTTDIVVLLKTPMPPGMQNWLFLAFFASFAVKVPMWPVHTWLPDAHVEAPTAGSVILAGVLLKMGGYGFLRFSVPMLPQASVVFRAVHLHAVGRRGDLHLAGGAGAGGHEEADRLFVRRAHGCGHDRHLHLQRAGHPGRAVPDAVARHRLRRAVPRVSASSMTASTRATSPATAAWPIACRSTR